MNKTYCITGASGLLGSEIKFLDKNSIGLSSKDCDLLKNSFYGHLQPKPDVVIHCAARVGGIKANIDYAADFFDDNIKMNMNVLQACQKRGIKLVSVLSTCVYPDHPHVQYPLTENQIHLGPPPKSNECYAYAKRMLEVQSRAYRQQFGSNFITVIPNNLYGINDNYDLESGHVIPALIRKFYEAKVLKTGIVTLWGTGTPEREFTYAPDAAKIILWLAENYDGEMPVNIGNPESVSIKKLAEIIADEVGFYGVIDFDKSKPDGQLKKPSSNAYLKSLGWKGEYTTLQEGLKETVQHFIRKYPNVRGIV